MTPEAAKEKFSGLEIIMTEISHRTCPDCAHTNFYPRLSEEEIISRFYPNYRKLINDTAIVG